MGNDLKTPQEYKFYVKIKGRATFDPSKQDDYDPCNENSFNKLANGYLKMYQNEIKKMFDSMTPLKMNPIIDGEFFFDGVDDEARE